MYPVLLFVYSFRWKTKPTALPYERKMRLIETRALQQSKLPSKRPSSGSALGRCRETCLGPGEEIRSHAYFISYSADSPHGLHVGAGFSKVSFVCVRL